MALSRRQVLRAVLSAPPIISTVQALTRSDRDANLSPALLRVNVPVVGLDRRLDGMRIAQISDVHLGAFLGLEHLRVALDLLRRRPPDLMTVTGDLLDDATLTQACLDMIAEIKAPYGTAYVMGNHENYAGRQEVMTIARKHPTIQFLQDEGRTVTVQGAKIHVIGLDYPSREEERLRFRLETSPFPHPVYSREFPRMPEIVAKAAERADDGDFRLALSHHPDFFDELHKHGVELTLSGHTHGGQVAPVGTGLARDAFRYNLGLYESVGRFVYVNGGTGHWYPLRISVPAEVTELTLYRV